MKEDRLFSPWLGSKWGKPGNNLNGTRLLIVGDSHYCPNHPEQVGTCIPDRTVAVVEEYLAKGGYRFFTGLTQIIAGRPRATMSTEEVRAVWDAVAFYNYVPVFAATKPGVRPTAAMFSAGREPFGFILKLLSPEAILVCGNDAWWWSRRGLLADPGGEPYKAVESEMGTALSAWIPHPSSRSFSSTEVRPIVERLLARVKPPVL